MSDDERAVGAAGHKGRRRRRSLSVGALGLCVFVLGGAAPVDARLGEGDGAHSVSVVARREGPRAKTVVSTATVTEPQQLGVGSVQEVSAPPLRPRVYAAAAATTSGVFVWGGYRERNFGITGAPKAFVDGAFYTPAEQTWTYVPRAPLTSGLTGAHAVALGDVAYVATGNQAAAWNVSTERWSRVEPAPEEIRALMPAAGRVIGVGWSGRVFQLDGRRWHEFQPPPRHTTVALTTVHSVWTGREVVVLARVDDGGSVSGFALDPARDQWRTLPDVALDPRSFDAVWSGDSITVVDYRNRTSRYLSTTDSWTSVSSIDADSGEAQPVLAVVDSGPVALLFNNVAVLDHDEWVIGDSWPTRPCCAVAVLDDRVFTFGLSPSHTNSFAIWDPAGGNSLTGMR
jgi:hypothetical protein